MLTAAALQQAAIAERLYAADTYVPPADVDGIGAVLAEERAEREPDPDYFGDLDREEPDDRWSRF